jgi:hypothetical protein
MRLYYFSIHVSYDGSIRGTISFAGDSTTVEHTLTTEQTDQLMELINQWKAQILDDASKQLLQARNDMLALEHAPSSTEPRVVDNDVIF